MGNNYLPILWNPPTNAFKSAKISTNHSILECFFTYCSTWVHHVWMVAYISCTSSSILHFLYWWQSLLCSFRRSSLIKCLVCISMDYTQCMKHMCFLPTMGIVGSQKPNILLIALIFVWALFAMKPLKLTFSIMPTLLTSFVKEDHMRTCESTSLDCISHIAIVNTLQYVML